MMAGLVGAVTGYLCPALLLLLVAVFSSNVFHKDFDGNCKENLRASG